MSVWSEERTSYVFRRFYNEGATDAQIAQELSAEIGSAVSKDKVYCARRRYFPERIGEHGRKRADANIDLRNEQIRQAIESGQEAERIIAKFGVSKSTIKEVAPASIYRRIDFRRHPLDRLALDYSLEGERTTAGFLFSEIEAGQCRFPIGKDMERDTYRFCGDQVEGRGPYCAEHQALSMVPSLENENYERLIEKLEKGGWL